MPAKFFLFLLVLNWNNILSSQDEEFRIIYIIHGDGNYLFHNKEGNAVNAAERILDQAQFVAENINKGEVLIFFQKPSESFLFFTNDDAEFYYYRNGLKISEETYSREYANDFEIEAGFIKKYSEGTSDKRKDILIYYGHEIPEIKSLGYHESYPEKEFGVKIFANGINRIINSFKHSDEKFDMVVLSTCRNGNEKTLEALSPFTKYLIASPGDIHLSYLSSRSLISLAKKKSISTEYLAKKFAQSAYEELAAGTSTEISIIVYDLINNSDEVKSIITNLHRQAQFGKRPNEVK